MAFHEKSPWIMLLALVAGGLYYAGTVASLSGAGGALASPTLPTIVAYTLVLVVIAVVGHIIIGALVPTEANAPIDERERRIFDRAAHWAGYVFTCGVLLALAGYLLIGDGPLLFYGVFASLMLGQFAEYALQILF